MVFVLATAPARAGVHRFTSIAPEGALVSALVTDPTNSSTLYAGTRAGVFKSIDAGETWTLAVDPTTLTQDSIVERIIGPIAIDPVHPWTLYAGTQTGEVMKTVDGGATWSFLDGIRQPGAILGLVVDPASTETIYALTRSDLLQSTDAGISWSSRAAVLVNDVDSLLSMAIDRLEPSRLYVGTTRGLYVTVDRGRNWSPSLGGPNVAISKVAVDPNDSNNVYVAGHSFLASTSDLGRTWTNVSVGYVFGIAIDPISSAAYATTTPLVSNGVDAVGKILVSTDHGHNWNPLPTALRDATLLAIDPSVRNQFYAASRGDLFKSENAGADWHSIHRGLRAAYVSEVLVDPAQPSTLFAAAYSGLVKSTDSGSHWSDVKLDLGAVQLATDPQNPSTLFAFNYVAAVRSGDGAASWTAIHPGDHVRGISVDPSDSAIVYAVFADGLAKSADAGSRWTNIGNAQLPLGYYGFDGGAIAVDPVIPTNVYAAGSAGIVKSTDAGTTWHTVFVDPDGLESYGPYFRKLVIDPRDPSTIYALSWTKVFRSDNAGQDWRLVFSTSLRGSYFSGFAIDPLQTSSLYLATTFGLFRSVDRGEQWAEFDEGIPTRFVNSVTVDSLGNVYASTPRGVFVNSPDNDLLKGASQYSISLRTDAGNFVSAKNCGSSYVDANESTTGPCETFTMYDLNAGLLSDGDAIHLRAANGGFVVAEGGGSAGGPAPVSANRGVPAAWETFVIRRVGGGGRIRSGDSITLQSSSGTYVSAENGGRNACQCDSRLNANRSVAREWETFVIVMH